MHLAQAVTVSVKKISSLKDLTQAVTDGTDKKVTVVHLCRVQINVVILSPKHDLEHLSQLVQLDI